MEGLSMKRNKVTAIVCASIAAVLAIAVVGIIVFAPKDQPQDVGQINNAPESGDQIELNPVPNDDAEQPKDEAQSDEAKSQVEVFDNAMDVSVLDTENDYDVDADTTALAKASLDTAIAKVNEMPKGLTELSSGLTDVANVGFYGRLDGLDKLYDCISNGGSLYNDTVYLFKNDALGQSVYKAVFAVTQPGEKYSYNGMIFDGYYDTTVGMFKIIDTSPVEDIDSSLAGLVK